MTYANKLSLLDSLIVANRMGKKVRLVDTWQEVKAHEANPRGKGIVEHKFLLTNCFLVLVETKDPEKITLHMGAKT